jgi:ABC-type dipeptide/oligopeptide/nickel transport system permease subunit
MVKTIEKVFTFFIVIILVIILINLFGPFISNSIQPAGDKVSDILHNAWTGLQHITGTDFGSPGDNHWSWRH